MNEIDIVRDISRRFEKAEISYMLTGSMAMNYYAQPRMTRDIDVVIAMGPKDVGRVAALFQPDYYVREENIRESVAHESIFNLIQQKISIRDFSTFLASKEDLIISKLAWAKDSHSEVQLGDVRNLLDTGYDAAYLRRWTRELRLDSLLEECLE
jgi:hypothetical protein